jgi:hypothetical protein
MLNLPALLIAASALVILFLGTMHLVFTFRGPAFHPRDPALKAAMQADSPRISRATTMWRAGIGFHASHSLGAMMFGVIYAYLALEGTGFLFHTRFLLALGMVVLLSYLVLAKIFWFKVPFRGIGLATLLYGAGLIVTLAA